MNVEILPRATPRSPRVEAMLSQIASLLELRRKLSLIRLSSL